MTTENVHVYVDRASGEWGYRSDLVMLTLTHEELDQMELQSVQVRRERVRWLPRYFGDIAESTRRHLSYADLAERETRRTQVVDPDAPDMGKRGELSD